MKDEYIYIDLRTRIASQLKEQGVSQSELARQVEITRQELNGFLKGRRALPLVKIERIMAVLRL